jgi:D-alanyl-D-alanine carboxypeptidase
MTTRILLRPLPCVTAAALFLSAAPAAAQHQAAPRPQAFAGHAVHAVDSLLAATYPAGTPGAVVLIAQDGAVLLRKAYGTADSATTVPLEPGHVFRIGAMTRQFMAVAVLLLAEDGALAIDEPVARYIAGWPEHAAGVTIEHVLTHTSGVLPGDSPSAGDEPRPELPLPELLAQMRAHGPYAEPGAEWRHSTAANVVLGAIIEQVSGAAWQGFLLARLFAPLGMGHTRFAALPGSPWHLVSTVDDLYAWHRAIEEGRLLRPLTWRRAFTPYRLLDGRSTGYGYGWAVGSVAGAHAVEHGCAVGDAVWVPSAGLHVIIVTGSARGTAPGAVAMAAAARLLAPVARQDAGLQ